MILHPLWHVDLDASKEHQIPIAMIRDGLELGANYVESVRQESAHRFSKTWILQATGLRPSATAVVCS